MLSSSRTTFRQCLLSMRPRSAMPCPPCVESTTMFMVPAGPCTHIFQRCVLLIPIIGVPRLTHRVIRSYRLGVAFSPRDNTPSSSIEKHCVLPPILCAVLPSRRSTYTSPLSYYTGPSSTAQCRRYTLLYPAVVPPFSLQCHLACQLPLFSLSSEVVSSRPRHLALG